MNGQKNTGQRQTRSEATGLSCYYSYSGDLDDLSGYLAMGESTAFKNLYTYALTGQPEDQDYVSSLGIDSLPQLRTLADTDWDGAPLDVDENGTAFLTLGPDAQDILSGIGFSLFYVDEENDQMMLLGTDNDMNGQTPQTAVAVARQGQIRPQGGIFRFKQVVPVGQQQPEALRGGVPDLPGHLLGRLLVGVAV